MYFCSLAITNNNFRHLTAIMLKKYTYNILLYYTDGASPYSHIQLRNTLEFSDFGNAATLRKKTIKISSKTNTTKGDTKAIQENISKDVKAVKNSKQIENDKKA